MIRLHLRHRLRDDPGRRNPVRDLLESAAKLHQLGVGHGTKPDEALHDL
jgi:hypothetical protein